MIFRNIIRILNTNNISNMSVKKYFKTLIKINVMITEPKLITTPSERYVALLRIQYYTQSNSANVL
jgi:hypothetical protein